MNLGHIIDVVLVLIDIYCDSFLALDPVHGTSLRWELIYVLILVKLPIIE